MIKTIQGGPYLTVSHYGGMHIDAYSGNANQGGVGQVRFNPNSQTLEVWDGTSWKNIMGHAEVKLNTEAESILNWAREERARQLQYEELAKKHPAVADALESVKDAELKLRELAILCTEDSPHKSL